MEIRSTIVIPRGMLLPIKESIPRLIKAIHAARLTTVAPRAIVNACFDAKFGNFMEMQSSCSLRESRTDLGMLEASRT